MQGLHEFNRGFNEFNRGVNELNRVLMSSIEVLTVRLLGRSVIFLGLLLPLLCPLRAAAVVISKSIPWILDNKLPIKKNFEALTQTGMIKNAIINTD